MFEDIVQDISIGRVSDTSNAGCYAEHKDRYFDISAELYELIRLSKEGLTDNQQLATIFSAQTGQVLSSGDIRRIKENFYKKLNMDGPTVMDGIRFRLRLLKPSWIGMITRYLSFLFQPALMVVVTALSIGLLTLVVFREGVENIFHQALNEFSPLTLLAASAIFSLITLFHELGHASACQRFGLRHGHIGFGIYFFTPVFYSDSTHAWKLPHHKRLLIDVGGMYFQLVVLIPLTLLYLGGIEKQLVTYLIILNISTILANLNPLLKYDGYWILADLLKINNLRVKTYHLTRHLVLRYLLGRDVKPHPYIAQIPPATGKVLLGYTLVTNVLFAFFFFYFIPMFLTNIVKSVISKGGELMNNTGDFAGYAMQHLSEWMALALNCMIALFLIKTVISFAMSCFRFFNNYLRKEKTSIV